MIDTCPVKVVILPRENRYYVVLLREYDEKMMTFAEFSDAGWELLEPVAWYKVYDTKDVNNNVSQSTEGHAIARRDRS